MASSASINDEAAAAATSALIGDNGSGSNNSSSNDQITLSSSTATIRNNLHFKTPQIIPTTTAGEEMGTGNASNNGGSGGFGSGGTASAFASASASVSASSSSSVFNNNNSSTSSTSSSSKNNNNNNNNNITVTALPFPSMPTEMKPKRNRVVKKGNNNNNNIERSDLMTNKNTTNYFGDNMKTITKAELNDIYDQRNLPHVDDLEIQHLIRERTNQTMMEKKKGNHKNGKNDKNDNNRNRSRNKEINNNNNNNINNNNNNNNNNNKLNIPEYKDDNILFNRKKFQQRADMRKNRMSIRRLKFENTRRVTRILEMSPLEIQKIRREVQLHNYKKSNGGLNDKPSSNMKELKNQLKYAKDIIGLLTVSKKEYLMELKKMEKKIKDNSLDLAMMNNNKNKKNKKNKKSKSERAKDALSKVMNTVLMSASITINKNDSIDILNQKTEEEREKSKVQPYEIVMLLKEKLQRNEEEMGKVKEFLCKVEAKKAELDEKLKKQRLDDIAKTEAEKLHDMKLREEAEAKEMLLLNEEEKEEKRKRGTASGIISQLHTNIQEEKMKTAREEKMGIINNKNSKKNNKEMDNNYDKRDDGNHGNHDDDDDNDEIVNFQDNNQLDEYDNDNTNNNNNDNNNEDNNENNNENSNEDSDDPLETFCKLEVRGELYDLMSGMPPKDQIEFILFNLNSSKLKEIYMVLVNFIEIYRYQMDVIVGNVTFQNEELVSILTCAIEDIYVEYLPAVMMTLYILAADNLNRRTMIRTGVVKKAITRLKGLQLTTKRKGAIMSILSALCRVVWAPNSSPTPRVVSNNNDKIKVDNTSSKSNEIKNE